MAQRDMIVLVHNLENPIKLLEEDKFKNLQSQLTHTNVSRETQAQNTFYHPLQKRKKRKREREKSEKSLAIWRYSNYLKNTPVLLKGDRSDIGEDVQRLEIQNKKKYNKILKIKITADEQQRIKGIKWMKHDKRILSRPTKGKVIPDQNTKKKKKKKKKKK